MPTGYLGAETDLGEGRNDWREQWAARECSKLWREDIKWRLQLTDEEESKRKGWGGSEEEKEASLICFTVFSTHQLAFFKFQSNTPCHKIQHQAKPTSFLFWCNEHSLLISILLYEWFSPSVSTRIGEGITSNPAPVEEHNSLPANMIEFLSLRDARKLETPQAKTDKLKRQPPLYIHTQRRCPWAKHYTNSVHLYPCWVAVWKCEPLWM